MQYTASAIYHWKQKKEKKTFASAFESARIECSKKVIRLKLRGSIKAHNARGPLFVAACLPAFSAD